jgi:hypothetical protein
MKKIYELRRQTADPFSFTKWPEDMRCITPLGKSV